MLDELSKINLLPSRSAKIDASSAPEKKVEQLTEASFTESMKGDAMASELLRVGIQKFTNDGDALKKLISERKTLAKNIE